MLVCFGMEKLYFITGNAGKFDEALSVIPGIKQIDLDLSPRDNSSEPQKFRR